MKRLVPIHHGGVVYLNPKKAPEFIYLTTCTLSILALPGERIDIPKMHVLCQVISNLPFQYKKTNKSIETTIIVTENQLHGQTYVLPINILK